MGKSTDAELKTMLSDLLVLGDKTQVYQNYDVENMITADVDASLMTTSTYAGVPGDEFVQNMEIIDEATRTVADWKAVSLTFKDAMDCIPEGFKAMVPAILILTFAWTLSGICGDEYLNIGSYVSGVVSAGNIPLAVIPIIFFAVALGLAFATGTSWGTFSILLPIVCTIFANDSSTLMVISMSAVMAGAVCGDHISPISDTTILSSTGAGCNHIEHVNTQLPYAMFIAVICCVCYLISGFANNGYIGLVIGLVLTALSLWIIKVKTKKEGSKSAA